jgi:hypothetical protein
MSNLVHKPLFLADRAKIVSFLTALQTRKLTLEQSLELEALMVKERNRAAHNLVISNAI